MATLKLQCDDGEIYRLTLQGALSFESVIQAVATSRHDIEPEMLSASGGCSLKYADDEGDLCTLAPATFNDFVEQQGGSTAKVLKLKLQLPKKLPPKKTDDLPKPETSPSASAEAQPGATERPRHGPPPGLGKEEDDASECSSSRAGLWGPCGGGGGPRRLVMALRALRDAGVLTPAMFASLAVQWLPLVTQRVTRKVDKINHMARDGLSQSLQKLLQEVKDRAAVTAGLESFAAPLGEALSDAPGPRTLGQAILELLKALRGLGFEAQARFSEGLASHLLPLLDDILAPQAEGSRERSSPWCGGPGPAAWQHHFGVECDGCKAAPLVGPRFKCPACPDYDLCGNCYTRKLELHGNCEAANRDFQCILFPGMGGQGKGKGAKGGQCSSGAAVDKGDPWMERGCGDWKAWPGKGGKLGFHTTAMAQAASHGGSGCGGPGMFLPPFAAVCGFPQLLGGAFDDPRQDSDAWSALWDVGGFGKGHGKGKGKGSWWRGKGFFPEQCDPWLQQQQLWIDKESCNEEELEKKLAVLRELCLGNDEVNRELLAANAGDTTRVAKLLLDA